MKVAIPKEITEAERRVALVPHLVPELRRLGCTVLMEKGAGSGAFYTDENYQDVEFVANRDVLFQQSEVILKVDAPTQDEIKHFQSNAVLIGMLSPHRYQDRIQALCERRITSFAMEFIPRISRAQSMDALSSQATIAGYKAVLLAANMQQRLFPMLTTAAGTIRPVNVLVIGAGVAGLQAIATARRLGGIVKAYDIRSAAREQVESLGAKMVTIDIKAEGAGGYARELTAEEKQLQQQALFDAVAKAEVVISTASVPGKPAPKIISTQMVEAMTSGAVIIDASAQSGGNCELTQPDEIVMHGGVQIYGPTNLPAMVARDASNMYSKNVVNFLTLLIKEGKLAINWDDQIISDSVLTHAGDIKHAGTQAQIAAGNLQMKSGTLS